MFYEDEKCGGASYGCKGCDDCVEVVKETTYRKARKARGNIMPGDLIMVTKGFEYQKGGKRLGYFENVMRVSYGTQHPPILQGLGWYRGTWRGHKSCRVFPAPALPPVAVERDALVARAKAFHGADPNTIAEAEAWVEEACAIEAAIEAFMAGVDIPVEYEEMIRAHLEYGGYCLDIKRIPRKIDLVALAESRLSQLQVREKLRAARRVA